MAGDLIPAGFTGRPVRVHLADAGARAVTLLGRVNEKSGAAFPACTDDQRAAVALTGDRRQEFLAGRTLLRHAVAELTGVSPDSVGIGTRGSGRPVCLSNRELDVSISHSAGRIAATAARGCEVGVDIQLPVPVSARLLHRYSVAGAEPATWVDTAPPLGVCDPTAAVSDVGERPWAAQVDDTHYEFADAWTVREACAKSLGLSLGADLWRIHVPPTARSGTWGGAHWRRMSPFQGCPVALALRPRT
ncbi:4'-phosphopantetheinyl transferase family protein [Streptomyces sp. NPDC102282]|uniref:4'-phosphopantetheinyl transferase family protein n=1 Tax=Streptomyces sp. NPDC102282 TaxID=3366154 RepID=UPI0037FC3126